MPSLFDPIDLSSTLRLPNRIVMAPLTRGRADRDGAHGPLAAEYYRQRAGAGLMWSDAQVEGWKPVQRGDRDSCARPATAATTLEQQAAA